MATLICLCLVAQCLIQLGIVGYYELNKSYIAANLCENRNKPQMKCCGKCYLRKQLKKAEDHSEGSKGCPGRIARQEESFFVVPTGLLIPVPHPYLFNARYFNPGVQDLHDRLPLFTVFRPPIMAV